MSRLEFAKRVGASPASVWNWESGTLPRGAALGKIAKTLAVSEGFLQSGDEKRARPVDRSADRDASDAAGSSVASILTRARNELAKASGLAPEQVKLSLEFALE